jgi:hypothetical protein
MAHYAFMNSDNVVVYVISGVNEAETQTEADGTVVGGSTEAWELFYESQYAHRGTYCKRTSYNNNFRGEYAGIGYTYDADLDEFVAPELPIEE